MSGAYQQRFGCYWNPHSRGTVLGAQRLMPQVLKTAGYATALIGKWNIAVDPATVFDEVHSVMDWEGDYFPDAGGIYKGVNGGVDSSKTWKWGPEREDDEYLTDRLGRHATEFIARHAQARAPFFLYVAFNAPHSPLQAKKAYRERFAHIPDEPRKLYAAMVASLDENVGRILDELERRGVVDRTMVAFVSDNGPARGGFRGYPEGFDKVVLGSTAGKRGQKGSVYQGGPSVPFILRWPAALRPGTVRAESVSTLDLLPTFAAAARATVPATNHSDGVNLLPFLTGENTGEPHDILFWWNLQFAAVIQGEWKLVLNVNPESRELYHLAADPNETTDVISQHPGRAEQLFRAWQSWSQQMPPPPPVRTRSRQQADE
jgi:arylsulfatase A-like enzyme